MTLEWCAGFGATVIETDPRIPYGSASGSQPSWSGTNIRCNFDGEGIEFTRLQIPNKTYRAALLNDFQISAPWSGASDGEKAFFLQLAGSDTIGAMTVRQIYHSGTGKFTLELVTTTLGTDDQVSESSSSYSYGASIGDIRIVSNGSTVTLEVDTGSGFSEECSITTSQNITNFRLKSENKSDASSYTLTGRYSCLVHYDNSSERVGIPLVTKLYPGADMNTYTDFSAGTTGGGGEEYTEIDDWVSGTYDSDTTRRGATGIATSATVRGSYPVNATFSESNDKVFVVGYGVGKSSGSGKSGTQYILITDGASDLEGAVVSGASSGSYVLGDYVFQTAPGSGAWEDYSSWANLEIGYRFTNGTDGAQNFDLTVVQLEVWDFPADPPATAGGPAKLVDASPIKAGLVNGGLVA